MAQPIPTATDKVHTQAPKWANPDGVALPCGLCGYQHTVGEGCAVSANERRRVRRETATVILAGFAGTNRGGGLDATTDLALEWTDLLLEKLSR